MYDSMGFFYGLSSFTKSVRVPVILVCGWGMYRMKFPGAFTDRSNDDEFSEDNKKL